MSVFNVLFIDDDPFMLKALLRTAKRLRPSWQFSGIEQPFIWLQQTTVSPAYDLIICDYQMPTMNGEQVLDQVSELLPAAMRVLLTGDTSEQVITHASKFCHLVMGKPFTELDLLQVFSSLERLALLPLNTQSRNILGRLKSLPLLPKLIRKIEQLLDDPERDLSDVAALLEHEPMLAAKLMQLANAAFLGFSKPVQNLHDAVLRLGGTLIKSIVTLQLLHQHFTNSIDENTHQKIADQALKQACYAKALAYFSGFSHRAQDLVFSAAMFSAIGRLLQYSLQPSNTKTPNEARLLQSGFENATLITVYILTLWGYDAEICDVILWQDFPSPEHEGSEQLAYVLFLTKQLLQSNTEDTKSLRDSIDNPQVTAGFEKLLTTLPPN